MRRNSIDPRIVVRSVKEDLFNAKQLKLLEWLSFSKNTQWAESVAVKALKLAVKPTAKPALPPRRRVERARISQDMSRIVHASIETTMEENYYGDDFYDLSRPFVRLSTTVLLMSPELYIEKYGGDSQAESDYQEIAIIGISPSTEEAQEIFGGGDIILGRNYKGWEVTDYE